MKILICTEALEMNGVMTSLLALLSHLDRTRYEVTLLCLDKDDGFIHRLPPGVKVLDEIAAYKMARAPFARAARYALRHGRLWELVRLIIHRALERWAPSRYNKWQLASSGPQVPGDYDVACAYSCGFLWELVSQKVAAKRKLFWLHTDFRYIPDVWRRYSKYFDRCLGPRCLVTVSAGIAKMLREAMPKWRENVGVVHNILDADTVIGRALEVAAPPRGAAYRLVTVGRYSHKKGQDIIPAIAEQLLIQGLDFEWYVVGPGCGKLNAAIRRCSALDGRVICMESLANPLALVESSDICVQPSRCEGWGLTLSEALILGTYTVASDIPSFREQIDGDADGLLVPFSVDVFAAAITMALRTRHDRAVIAARSRERFAFDTDTEWRVVTGDA